MQFPLGNIVKTKRGVFPDFFTGDNWLLPEKHVNTSAY